MPQVLINHIASDCWNIIFLAKKCETKNKTIFSACLYRLAVQQSNLWFQKHFLSYFFSKKCIYWASCYHIWNGKTNMLLDNLLILVERYMFINY